ncbi:hypothetical protein PAXINDRAFT_20440 [Paxillus involutus ATCC 200175]|uniref:Uncharacterized protein n=1 Tax=Paxillus involutus ATCC 200175 TaxID=664439 RepID=A0A0C9TDS7_PAXIN|nr:hypothetical protein PAXINDRAFT_20440 [Paxillus involutus ATCC 200175]
MVDIPALRTDGRNWMDYREKILRAAAQQGLDKLYDGTETIQGNAEDWQQRNTIAKSLIVETIPDSILLRILHFKSTHEFFEGLKNLFEQDVATLELLQELRNNRSKREATYGLESANDRIHRRSHVTDASHRDDEVSSRSGRRQVHVPRSEPRPERKREPTSQRRVERRCGVGEEGRVSKGEKDDEQVAAVSSSTHHNLTPLPRHHHHYPISPPPCHPSRRQRCRDGHVRVETRRRRRDDDDEWSRGGVESRSRGYRETNDDDGSDVDVHRAYVVPQEPHTVSQTALDEAADTSNPNATSAGMTMPVGTSNGPPNGSSEVEGEGGKGEGNERASGIVDPSSNGENAVPDSIPPTTNPDERGPPPSMPLEGEKNGQQASGHVDDTATHLERPRHESTTQQPRWTPYDQRSSGEGRGEGVGGDDEVEGNDD